MTGEREVPKGEQDPMPVFVIKAKDNLALEAIWHYREKCLAAGLTDQALQVRKAYREVLEWRKRHSDHCQMPDHPHVPASSPGLASGEEGEDG